jgi:hypothetical protein
VSATKATVTNGEVQFHLPSRLVGSGEVTIVRVQKWEKKEREVCVVLCESVGGNGCLFC